jgi:AhpD family alkylhydroperoxidase
MDQLSEEANRVEEFLRRRASENERLLAQANLPIKRFFALDGDVYSDGALTKKQKELIGLTASAVLRCDDCITYHLIRAREHEATDEEIIEALTIALIVGGSITIPHLRRAFALLDQPDLAPQG